jgi:hypothetical protein
MGYDGKEIWKLCIEFFFSLHHDLEWTNEPSCELASSMKHHKPLIGDSLMYTKSPTSKLNSLLL